MSALRHGNHLTRERSFNPGSVDPNNTVWSNSRRPLVAAWEANNGARFFTINVHDTAKSSASSSTQGNPRPPINSDVEKRTAQVEVIAVRDRKTVSERLTLMLTKILPRPLSNPFTQRIKMQVSSLAETATNIYRLHQSLQHLAGYSLMQIHWQESILLSSIRMYSIRIRSS